MRKSVATFALAAGIAGGAGALAFAPGFAGAQSATGTLAADPTATGPKAVLDGLVADGTLTQGQADIVLDRLKAAMPKGGRGGPKVGIGPASADVAGFLGLTADQLRDALKSGKTLAALAAEQGKSVDELVNLLVTAETKAIDDAVANGRLTADQAATLKSNLAERTRNMVENGRPGPGGPGFGGPWRHHPPVAPASTPA